MPSAAYCSPYCYTAKFMQQTESFAIFLVEVKQISMPVVIITFCGVVYALQ